MQRKFTFVFTAVTIAASLSWGVLLASMWLPVDHRVMLPVMGGAIVSSVALVQVRTANWLREHGMVLLLNALLNQRAAARPQAQTEPFRVIR